MPINLCAIILNSLDLNELNDKKTAPRVQSVKRLNLTGPVKYSGNIKYRRFKTVITSDGKLSKKI